MRSAQACRLMARPCKRTGHGASVGVRRRRERRAAGVRKMLLALRPRWARAARSAGRDPASGGWMGMSMPTASMGPAAAHAASTSRPMVAPSTPATGRAGASTTPTQPERQPSTPRTTWVCGPPTGKLTPDQILQREGSTMADSGAKSGLRGIFEGIKGTFKEAPGPCGRRDLRGGGRSRQGDAEREVAKGDRGRPPAPRRRCTRPARKLTRTAEPTLPPWPGNRRRGGSVGPDRWPLRTFPCQF